MMLSYLMRDGHGEAHRRKSEFWSLSDREEGLIMEPQRKHGRRSKSLWRTPNVWVFSLASLFSDWGHEMVTALMPGFLLSIGAPAMALGLTEGISNLAQAVTALWGGRVNDRKTHRHLWLIIGYVLTGLKALMAFVYWWPWVVLLRTLGWSGRGARGPIRDAYIAEEVPAQAVGKAYGLREMFDTFGAVLGPLGAGLLVAVVSARTLIAWTAIPAIITVLVILKVRKVTPSPIATTPMKTSQPVAWGPLFIRYRWATFIFAMGYVAPTFFILRVWQSHVTLGSVSAHTLALLLYALHNAIYALSSYPVGWLSDRIPGRPLLLLGYGIWTMVIAGFFVGLGGIGWWISLFALAGLATGLIEVAQKLATVRLTHATSRGQGLGQIAAVRGGAALASGIIMGGLWTVGNPQIGFGVEAGVALMGLTLMSTVGRNAV